MKNKTLGNRIKLLREELRISQLELSKILNIANTTLSQYESDKRIPSDSIKKKLAEHFNVSLDYLMGLTDIRNAYLNYNSNNSRADSASRLTDEFYALLIKHGVIKDKKELTPAKAIKILDMIFNEDDNNSAKDTED